MIAELVQLCSQAVLLSATLWGKGSASHVCALLLLLIPTVLLPRAWAVQSASAHGRDDDVLCIGLLLLASLPVCNHSFGSLCPCASFLAFVVERCRAT